MKTTIAISLICGTILGSVTTKVALNDKLRAYSNYKNSVEILLDKVYEDDSDFLDTIGETDEYYDYIESRNALN